MQTSIGIEGVQTNESSEVLVCSGMQIVPSKTTTFKDAGVQTFRFEECATDLHAMSVAFSNHCKHVLMVEVCEDFLELASSAMVRLKASNRSNVVYNIAKGIGTSRMNEEESLFPVGRMPMGLVEYTANFFVAEDSNLV